MPSEKAPASSARKLAVAQLKQNLISDAIQTMTSSGSGSVEDQLLLAELHSRNRETDKAISIVKSVVAEHPDNAVAWRQLSVLHGRCRQIVEAVETAKRAISLDPENPNLLHHLGLQLQATNKFTESLEPLNHAIRINGASAAFYLTRGTSLQKLKRLTEAEADLRQSIALDKTNERPFSQLVALLCSRGRKDEAEAVLREALLTVPKPDQFKLLLRELDRFDTPEYGPFREFCQKFEIDFENLRRYSLGPTPSSFSLNHAGPGRPEAFRMSRFGRFGNAFIQILNALVIMRKLGVKLLILPPHPFFNWGDIEVDGIRIVNTEDNQKFEHLSIIAGQFFDLRQFYRLREQTSPEDFTAVIKTYFRPFIEPAIRGNTELDTHSLVLHFRSGDIFTSDKPHPGYSQPPLSYYILALDHHLKNHPNASVVLAFECRANPCVDAMEAVLRARNIPYRVQNADLKSDLSLLVAASHIAWGYGTFGKAVNMLSSHLKTTYHFENQRPSAKSVLASPDSLSFTLGFDDYVIFAKKNSYIPTNTWKNSSAQRQLMLDYPITDLSLISLAQLQSSI